MNKDKLLKDYFDWQYKLSSYTLALQTISFDISTIAPSKGKTYKIERMSYLSGEHYKLLTDPKINDLINELLKYSDLDFDIRKELELLKISKEKISCIPLEEYMNFSKYQRETNLIWEQAKEQDDFNIFKSNLDNLVKMIVKNTKYRNNGDIFDNLIDDYERGMSKKEYDFFFDEIERELLPLIKKIKSIKQPVDSSILKSPVKIEIQKEITELICDYLNFDRTWGYFGESVHPFTSAISKNDVRLTTRYHEDDFISNIYSVIHELGHGIFEHQVDEKYDGRLILDEITSGLHESQSRLLENYIGKSYSFWKANYSVLQSKIAFLKDVSLDDFYKMINLVGDSKIRIESDELTYPIHILIRYRIEEAMVNNTVSIDDLPALWNKYMKDYLDLDITNNAEGILQDVHWSYGMLGYFPTYALGSAYAAQIFNTMKKELDIDHLLISNNFKVINEWLKDNIHKHAGLYNGNEMLEKVTNEKFNPKYYIDYLKDKFTKIYNL